MTSKTNAPQNLKLREVRISRFRRFEKKEFKFLSPSQTPMDYVIISGPNGCGKTTLLEAILLGLGHDTLASRNQATNKPRPQTPLLNEDTEITIFLGPTDQDSHTIQINRRGTGEFTFELFNYLNNGQPSANLVLDISKNPEVWPHNICLPTEYISSRRIPSLTGPVQDATSGRPPADTESNRIWRFKHRVRQQQGRRVPGYQGPEPLDQEWMGQLNAFWREFRPDGSKFVMSLKDPNNLDISEWDIYLYKNGQRICGIDELSSGEIEVIGMAVPFITQSKPFAGLLLIDEPELHLHPQWQGKILRAIRAMLPDAQIIAATHANAPWDDAMSWERILLVEEGDPRARQEAMNSTFG